MIAIDFYFLVYISLPNTLRNINLLSFIYALIKPLDELKVNFYAYYASKKYELSFTGQVISLEYLLNDLFDPTLRRIYIGDPEQQPDVFIFNESENNEPIYLFNELENIDPTYLFNTFFSPSDNDFIVFVPIGLAYDSILMKSYLNKYKIASKRYLIQEI